MTLSDGLDDNSHSSGVPIDQTGIRVFSLQNYKDCLIKFIPALVCLFLGFLFTGAAAAQDGRAESLALTCYTCHSDRPAESKGIPSLEPLGRKELIRLLTEFRDGTADATVMDRISTAYTDEEIGIIADYITARNKGK